jgi:biopolymer transport protein ExbD
MIPDISRSVVREGVRIDMTSLIDTTFLLLIYFLVTMRFRAIESQLHTWLPADRGPLVTTTPLIEEKELEILIRQSRGAAGARPAIEQETRYYIGGESEAFRVSPDRVAEVALTFIRKAPDAKAVIDAGSGVPHARVVEVLDILSEAGLSELRIRGIAPGSRVFSDPEWFERTEKRLLSGR